MLSPRKLATRFMASDTFPLRVGPRNTVLARTYRDFSPCLIFNDPEVDTGSRITPISDDIGNMEKKVKHTDPVELHNGPKKVTKGLGR